MINNLGYYSLFFCAINSLIIIFVTSLSLKKKNYKLSSNLLSLLSLQLIFVLTSFFSLIYLFVTSDFSNETVFNNSHTTKPIFYKISGTWGNHEGSLLLWLLVLTIFIFLYTLFSKSMGIKQRIFTIIFQQIIISGFISFMIFTSNPFSNVFPVPFEGLGLNPILQDPALAIHPPILYIGYVGTSILFSSSLSALITNSMNKLWAAHIKKWILISWIFLTLGILLGSIWAYYELGWGGFWFWDPVENVSLMPWFCLTALLHSIIVLEKREILKSWVIILSLSCFILSMSGTFLVRSGILNSVHTFASDPSRGTFILTFLFLLLILSIVIVYFFLPQPINSIKKTHIFSKETLVIVNNLFLMYFLSVVLIGTIYPIFLEVINNQKISIGPPFYNKLIIPFLIPFLFLMILATKTKWIKHNFKRLGIINIFIFLVSVIIAIFIIKISDTNYLFSTILFIFSILLFLHTCKDFLDEKTKLSQKFSHIGFSALILSILLNGVFSKEVTSNMLVGDKVIFSKKTIIFDSVSIRDEKNFKALEAKFILKDFNGEKVFSPEVRIYDQPSIFTSEADIKIGLFEDNFFVFNIVDDDYFNVRYQYKPLMLFIWISTILISVGGLIALKEKYEKY
jgi:cytochrome c-type biogenesis protein CcmF|tara:strand:- start:7771 stop:9645 length:1875 start_codon:yes stop_codon:yes gene_type:complete